jgi:hypothetical protein
MRLMVVADSPVLDDLSLATRKVWICLKSTRLPLPADRRAKGTRCRRVACTVTQIAAPADR